jgi:hypothetical protein
MIQWLLENKFPYDSYTFGWATDNGNLNNMKWLLENKFPYDDITKKILIKNKLISLHYLNTSRLLKFTKKIMQISSFLPLKPFIFFSVVVILFKYY